MADRHKLIWSTITPASLPELPPQVTRQFIFTPQGNLELLSSQPPTAIPRKQALFFLHGGFGSALVWLPFLVYFSQRGNPSYALSLRGHGASWKPGFFRLVWMTGKSHLAEDLGHALSWVEEYEVSQREGFSRRDIVLVGHSAGGGLSQYYLGSGLGQVGGLVLIAAVPCYGQLEIYKNWFRLDPWFTLRYYIRDLWHPRSPLSSTTLVKNAFFSADFPIAKVKVFEDVYMVEYESMLWPLGMMFSFTKPIDVLRNIVRSTDSPPRVLVIAGDQDKLTSVLIMRTLTAVYREAYVSLFGGAREQKLNARDDEVKFVVVKDSGHHLMNDRHWEEAAKEVFEFVETF